MENTTNGAAAQIETRTVNPAVSALLAQAGPAAEGLTHCVHILALSIADWMKKIHGGEFSIQIDHECGLVMVVQRGDRQIAKPRSGEIV